MLVAVTPSAPPSLAAVAMSTMLAMKVVNALQTLVAQSALVALASQPRPRSRLAAAAHNYTSIRMYRDTCK